MTAEYCENRSIFCKNLSTSIRWLGSRSNLAILTSRANLRMSTEVSDSWGVRGNINTFQLISDKELS